MLGSGLDCAIVRPGVLVRVGTMTSSGRYLALGGCLAVGVFSQILWDDRPITAPLAHLSWRNR